MHFISHLIIGEDAEDDENDCNYTDLEGLSLWCGMLLLCLFFLFCFPFGLVMLAFSLFLLFSQMREREDLFSSPIDDPSNEKTREKGERYGEIVFVSDMLTSGDYDDKGPD